MERTSETCVQSSLLQQAGELTPWFSQETGRQLLWQTFKVSADLKYIIFGADRTKVRSLYRCSHLRLTLAHSNGATRPTPTFTSTRSAPAARLASSLPPLLLIPQRRRSHPRITISPTSTRTISTSSNRLQTRTMASRRSGSLSTEVPPPSTVYLTGCTRKRFARSSSRARFPLTSHAGLLGRFRNLVVSRRQQGRIPLLRRARCTRVRVPGLQPFALGSRRRSLDRKSVV